MSLYGPLRGAELFAQSFFFEPPLGGLGASATGTNALQLGVAVRERRRGERV